MLISHLAHRVGRERGSIPTRAIDHDIRVPVDLRLDFRLERTAWNEHGTGNVPQVPLIRLAHIEIHNPWRGFGVGNPDFGDASLGVIDEVASGPYRHVQESNASSYVHYIRHHSSMSDINERIADRVRNLRSSRGLTLDALAQKSGVSRSMISLIERAESAPTAVVLERLATGLDVPLASLFDEPAPRPEPISRRADQLQWRDPASSYVRRNVSPSGVASPIQIVEVEFPPGARVAFDSGTYAYQQVWVLDGSIEIRVGTECYALNAGDCAAFTLDRPTAFSNPSTTPARYCVVIAR